jgi:hypothetical protein
LVVLGKKRSTGGLGVCGGDGGVDDVDVDDDGVDDGTDDDDDDDDDKDVEEG